ncbi:hypothetical protein C7M84_004728, partial [Penaeus vannamei]
MHRQEWGSLPLLSFPSFFVFLFSFFFISFSSSFFFIYFSFSYSISSLLFFFSLSLLFFYYIFLLFFSLSFLFYYFSLLFFFSLFLLLFYYIFLLFSFTSTFPSTFLPPPHPPLDNLEQVVRDRRVIKDDATSEMAGDAGAPSGAARPRPQPRHRRHLGELEHH